VIPDWVAYEVTKVLETNMTSGTPWVLTSAESRRERQVRPRPRRRLALRLYATARDGCLGRLPDAERGVYVHGVALAGGNIPASIWHDFMSPAMASMPERDLQPQTAARFTPWTKGATATSAQRLPTRPRQRVRRQRVRQRRGRHDAGDNACNDHEDDRAACHYDRAACHYDRAACHYDRAGLSRRATEQSVAVDAPFRPRAASVLCQRAEAMCEPLREQQRRALARGR